MTDFNPENVPVIVFANQKGGVAKTTSADAVSEWMRARGLKVLAIDMDTQNSLGSLQRRYVVEGSPTSLSFIKGEDVATTPEGQATLCGEAGLAGLSYETDLEGNEIQYDSLKKAVRRAIERHGFDAVVIDTHPGMSFTEICSLVAATHIIIPTTPDVLGIEGIIGTENACGESEGGMATFLEELQASTCSSAIEWRDSPAILICKYRSMTSIDRTCAAEMTETFREMGFKVFKTRPSLATVIQQFQAHKQSIYSGKYMPKAVVEYRYLTETIMEWCGLESKEDGEEGGDE